MNESWLVEKAMLTSNNEVSFHKWIPELVSGGLQKSRLTLVEKGLIVALYSNYGVYPVGGFGTKYQAAHLMRKDLSMEGKFGIWNAHDMSTHGFVPLESVIFNKLTLATPDKWAAEYLLINKMCSSLVHIKFRDTQPSVAPWGVIITRSNIVN